MTNPLKEEHYLPTFMDSMIGQGKARVKVLHSPAKWYGVTYREDAAALRCAIADMIEQGMYPGK